MTSLHSAEMSAHPEFASKVAFLLRGAFAEPPEAVETHMSWVFLTTDHVYKLKKPVRHRFLDYRTVEARRLDCEAEVALNEALAPGVYLRTIPLTSDAGTLALDGRGEVVDWLVVMRRLPESAMLDQRLARGDATPAELAALAELLLAFYRSTSQEPLSPEEHRRSLTDTLRIDRDELQRPEHLLDRSRTAALTDALATAVARHPDLDDRAGRVVDGHGDLRPEHVVLGPNPMVIDRITFDPRLRRVDPFYDLALLSTECERLGSPEIAAKIIDGYVELSGDPIQTATVQLYQSLRAATRARLSIAHLRDGDRDAPKWLDRTDDYMTLAETHLARHTDEVRSLRGSDVEP